MKPINNEHFDIIVSMEVLTDEEMKELEEGKAWTEKWNRISIL